MEEEAGAEVVAEAAQRHPLPLRSNSLEEVQVGQVDQSRPEEAAEAETLRRISRYGNVMVGIWMYFNHFPFITG